MAVSRSRADILPGRNSVVVVVAAALVVALATLGWLGVPAAIAQTSRALYYETETRAGTLAIDRLSLSPPGASTQVVGLGDVNLFGIALGGPYIYWSTQAGPKDRGAIMRATLDGGDVRPLVSGLPGPAGLIVVHGFLYWVDQDAIGRVALDGSHLRRRFIAPPPEPGGGVADGLASDGRHLYFTRCTDDEISRENLNGSRIDLGYISLGPDSCPQGIAVAGGHLYWTQLPSGTIGRATVGGQDANGRWLAIHSVQGPFQVVADRTHVYWTWGGVAGAPSYTGRADANGSHLEARFLTDSLFPMALAGGDPSSPAAGSRLPAQRFTGRASRA